MKKKDLNNQKKEWVTPLIKEMTINDCEGKAPSGMETTTPTGATYGPS